MLLTAPGKTSQMPTVATVSIAPLVRALFSIARISSAAAQRASRRSGIKNTAGVSARTFNQNAETRRCGDFRNNAERNLLLLQQRPLLNV